MSRCRSVVSDQRALNGTTSRKPKSTCTPGRATRSSLRNSMSSRSRRWSRGSGFGFAIPLAQEALELAGQDVAGGQPSRVEVGLPALVVRPLEPLDQLLRGRVALDRRAHLPL